MLKGLMKRWRRRRAIRRSLKLLDRIEVAERAFALKRSQQPEPAALPLEEQPADKSSAIEAFENFDSFAKMRNAIREIACERDQWSGIPMPLEGVQLTIEPTFPMAKELMEIGRKETGAPDGAKIRNTFWSTHLRSTVVIHEKDGKIGWGIIPGVHHIGFDVQTLMCSEAWGLEQEHNALQLLGTIVSHRQMKQYILTGMFMEKSQRSKLTYLFRRLKPTVVLDARSMRADQDTRILCCLCMHPIAFYNGSWAGAMCPTDDVIAHLSLMRGDEPMYWRRAKQHAPYRPEAGL